MAAAGSPPHAAPAGRARAPAWSRSGLRGRRLPPAGSAKPAAGLSASEAAWAPAETGRAIVRSEAQRQTAHKARREGEPEPSRRPGRASRSARPPACLPASSGPGSASETGLRKAKHRRKSYLCRLLRSTTRRGRAGPLPVYTCWDSFYKSDTRLICRQSLCTGQKEGAFMTTCHRLNLRKPLQWSNK